MYPFKLTCLFSYFFRSMSIPETLTELCRKLEKSPTALPSPCLQANQEAKNNLLLSPRAIETKTSSNLPQKSPVTDRVPPGSACIATSGATSQLRHAINVRATDGHFPLCPVDAVPDWSVSHLPEISWIFHMRTWYRWPSYIYIFLPLIE